MNLVAKEFLASRVDGDGVLILSEFAGAAAELGEAVVVNPYDVDALADAIRRALAMDETARRVCMRSLRRRMLEYDVHRWAARFIAQLSELGTTTDRPRSATPADTASLAEERGGGVALPHRGPRIRARQAHELRMLLGDALSNQPLEVPEGKKVIEVRVRGSARRSSPSTCSPDLARRRPFSRSVTTAATKISSPCCRKPLSPRR